MEAVSRFPTQSALFAAARTAVMTIWDYSPDSSSLHSSYPPMVRDALAVAGNAAEAVPSEPPVQAALLRDIFGNPFRPVAIEHGWLTWNDGTIPKIAQAIYDDRAFDRLLVLADALEEAGCTNADLLNHCREPGPHVRGCWVVDLVLGRE